jgi:hypothetical protein
MALIAFVERRPDDGELRAQAAGVFPLSSFLCVNTCVLKNLLRRCKSSINSGLSHLGYNSVRVKEAKDSAVVSALESLLQCAPTARQWSLRACSPRFSFAHHQPLEPPRAPAFSVTIMPMQSGPNPFDEREEQFDGHPAFFSDDMDGERFGDDFALFR